MQTTVLLFGFLLAALAPQGRASDVNLVVGVRQSAAGVRALLDRLAAISDPTHADYGRHMDRDAIAALVRSTDDDIASVERWLRGSIGAADVWLRRSGDALVASFDSAAPSLVPLVPPELKSIVDFLLLQSPRKETPMPDERPVRRPQRRAAAGTDGTPAAQRASYGLPDGLVGTNETNLQMVWGPGTYGFAPSDLQLFYKTYGIDPNNIDMVQFDTANHGTNGGDNFGEGTLDVTWISALAVNVSTLVSNTNTSSATEEGDGFGAALLDFATQLNERPRVPYVLSMSLGSLSAHSCITMCQLVTQDDPKLFSDCWAYTQTQRQVCMFMSDAQQARIEIEFAKLGARGVTLLGASGDGGSHWSFMPFDSLSEWGRKLNKVGCAYNWPTYPASSQYVLAVGGTSWDGTSPQAPVGWSGSGSGFSWVVPQPSWQQATVSAYLSAAKTLPNFPAPSSFNASGRAYPDVSALASSMPMCLDGQCQDAAGTSGSTPEWAAVISLLNDARLNNGLPPLGFVNPRIYQVASQFPGVAFKDITVGNTKTSCPDGFPAIAGWDAQTGWGQPIWDGLVQHFTKN
eukprot:TRINITY_DN26903_c0_g1_i1.p1 TRINITY_DN26903_c0_g1~~TRINITY_DN26903_c0_g1_i1.p1  ORF type:complete len:574 (-),score=185.27 TRINITY_DN26903_c0_g1_i1:128-1849(-)